MARLLSQPLFLTACLAFSFFTLSACSSYMGDTCGNEGAPITFSRPLSVPAVYVGGSNQSIEAVHEDRLSAIESNLEQLMADLATLTLASSLDGEGEAAGENATLSSLNVTYIDATLKALQVEVEALKNSCACYNASECEEGYFGANCTACSTCSHRGICHDGKEGSGRCLCFPGFSGEECESCAALYYGPDCTPCPSCSSGQVCNDGIAGDGVCS
mmetsp:Transcript_43694/g.113893  ORF Transcript_43694/g.113893 Transcript_43694/m.113893 type:complete len:216 (-) Transcript_43694:1551-2198(-)